LEETETYVGCTVAEENRDVLRKTVVKDVKLSFGDIEVVCLPEDDAVDEAVIVLRAERVDIYS
jgi:hypothetical protein